MLSLSEWASCVPGAICKLNFAAFTASTWKCSPLQEIMIHLGHIKYLIVNLEPGKHTYANSSLPYLVWLWDLLNKDLTIIRLYKRIIVRKEDNGEIAWWVVTFSPNDSRLSTGPLPTYPTPQDALFFYNQECLSIVDITSTEEKEKIDRVCSLSCLKDAEHTSCLTIKISQVFGWLVLVVFRY